MSPPLVILSDILHNKEKVKCEAECKRYKTQKRQTTCLKTSVVHVQSLHISKRFFKFHTKGKFNYHVNVETLI